MKVKIGNNIETGYLDYYLNYHEVRIKVNEWYLLEKIDDQYINQERSIKRIFNYIRKIGLFNTLLKIFSRESEKNRDKKFFSFGYGVVIDSLCDRYSKNSMIAFLATNHPEMVDVITINGDLVRFTNDTSLEIEKLKYFDLRRLGLFKKYNFDNLVGYSIYSGRYINPDIVENIFKELTEDIHILKKQNIPDLIFDINDREIITSKSNIVNSTSNTNKVYAILFGFGQYAKTIVIPNLSNISVKQINEVDPLQLPLKLKSKYSYSTAESFNNIDIDAQIVIIAGFHHTHAELLEKALIRGMFAIVEKPLCVDINQFYRIKDIIVSNPKKVFLCFHKRYHVFNEYIFKDMGIQNNTPINYHCIIYEIPLPNNHWYNWPNSHSRIISNGCHWIDHFIFLNNFADIKTYDLNLSQSIKTINVFIELSTGATFTMVLTEEGSSRLGVREIIELRANSKTVTIADDKYKSEDNLNIIREKRINPLQVYSRMYKEIYRKIESNVDGENLKSIKSSELSIKLDQLFYEKKSVIENTSPSC